MTSVSIKKGVITFTFDDGEVKDVNISKQSSLDEMKMPASDSNSTFVLDLQGVGKTIRISGSIYDTSDIGSRTDSGASIVTIEDQINWLTAVVNGSQNGCTFNSTYQTNIKVYCRSCEFNEKAGEINKVDFNMEFVEGA